MGFEYFKLEDGATVLTYNYLNFRERRVFPLVNLVKFELIATKHELSPVAKVKLLLKLEDCRNIYNIGAATDTSSADTALARWIGEIEKSISRISSAKTNDEVKFKEALGALESVGDNWVKAKIEEDGNDIELLSLGFDVQYVEGFTSAGSHLFIRRWFEHAKLIEQFTKDAKKRLKALDRPKNRLRIDTSKETLLYGVQLPRLYKQITRRPFGISKVSDQVVRKNGIAFVLDCADAIGLPPVTASNVASHWNKSKRQQAG